MAKIVVDPVTRIEGHLKLELLELTIGSDGSASEVDAHGTKVNRAGLSPLGLAVDGSARRSRGPLRA